MTEQITEAIGLNEAESLGSGKYRVLAISVGRGSSGVYPRETLIEAANNKLIKRGTHSFIDHPSESENRDRPERSVRDLAGVFTSDAVWDEQHQGLVAEMQVLSPYRHLFSELAEHVGLSIRGDGEIEMREGERTVTSLAHISSVDLVTRAGRGGKVLSLLESARPTFNADDMAAATGVPNDATQDPPAPLVEEAPTTPKEAPVAELSEAEVTALRTSVTEAEAARDAALAEAATLRAERDQLRLAAQARPIAAAHLAEAQQPLPAAAQARVLEAVLAGPVPVNDQGLDAAALTASVDTVAAREAAYLQATGIAATVAATPLFGSFGSATESASTTGQLNESDIDAAAGSAFGRTPKGA